MNIWTDIKKLTSSDSSVSKFVFRTDSVIAESVLYQYPTYADRTVICCSVQSGCNVKCNFCFLPDEIVDTVNGRKKIQDVLEGEFVLSYDLKNDRNSINTVNKVLNRHYSGNIIEIEAENGEIIRVTEDHEIILIDKSIKLAKDLTENDEILSFS